MTPDEALHAKVVGIFAALPDESMPIRVIPTKTDVKIMLREVTLRIYERKEFDAMSIDEIIDDLGMKAASNG